MSTQTTRTVSDSDRDYALDLFASLSPADQAEIIAFWGRFLLRFFDRCAMVISGTASNGRRLALGQGAASCPLILRKGGCPMVTYSDLFQFCILIVGICGLFIQVYKKK